MKLIVAVILAVLSAAVSPLYAASYDDGVRDATAQIEAAVLSLGIDDARLRELFDALRPPPVTKCVGTRRVGLVIDSWPRTDKAAAGSALAGSFAEYNKRMVESALRDGEPIHVHSRMRSMPGHILFATIDDGAAAVGCSRDDLLQWSY
jgi:type II secretory pathway pseudopilin PulG